MLFTFHLARPRLHPAAGRLVCHHTVIIYELANIVNTHSHQIFDLVKIVTKLSGNKKPGWMLTSRALLILVV